MLDLAKKRAIYDRLEVAEISRWLMGCTESFDLIVACDSLIYFGDLRQVLIPAARLLKPGGLLVFTLESDMHSPFHLTDSGRYTHHPDHVREVADKCGLDVLHLARVFLRMEFGEKVIGLLVALGESARDSRSPN
jgi:predicted TPR repeat methyltransferase